MERPDDSADKAPHPLRDTPAQDGPAPVRAADDRSAEPAVAQTWSEIALCSIGDGVIATDTEGTVVFLNPVAETLTGWTAQEARGQPLAQVFTLIDESTRQAVPLPIGQVLRDGTPAPLTGRLALVARGGREVAIEDSAAPIKDIRGKVSGLVLVFRDVTQRRQADETQARLAAIVQSCDDAIVGKTLEGIVTTWNQGAERILGYRADEMIGQPITRIIPPERHAEEDYILGRLRRGEVVDHYETVRITKDGRHIHASLTCSPIRGADGSIVGASKVLRDITQPRRIDAERVRLANVLDKSLNEVYLFDAATLRFQYVNPCALANLGYSAATIRSLTPLDLKPEFDERSFRDLLQPLLTGETEKRVFRTVHRRADGSDYPVEVHLQLAAGTDAEDKAFLAVILDVTERLQAEQALRQSEAELRALADSIPQLAWMAEPDGRIFWYNRRWYEYTGTTLEQMEGWGWRAVHDPAVLPSVMERWQHSLQSGEPFEMEFPLRGADGGYRWFLTRVEPVRDAAGKVLRWFGTNTDVDQVKRVREALRDETRMLELLNSIGHTLSSNLDLGTLVQSVTDAATRIVGAAYGAFFYNVEDANGESLTLYTLSGASPEPFAAFGMPRNTALFDPTFRGEEVVRCDDVLCDPRYGSTAPHHGLPPGHPPVRSYLAVPVISRSGEVIGGLLFGHPETHRFIERHERVIVGMAAQAAISIDNARLYEAAQKAAEERKLLLERERSARAAAERSSGMKDAFLANLSHELRTPLSAILGWSQVLRHHLADNPDMRHGLDAIERNARTQAQLIEDLLDMSRIASGKVRLDVQTTDPTAFIEAAVETVRPAAESKGIRVEKFLDPLAGPISGDPGRLQQVIWNLLTNAVKFTPRGGKVQVVLARVNSHIEISVADTGSGIRPDFLPHLFERFRQADSTTTRKHGGLGLGLSIVKQLVELHGGSVSAKSDGEGRGATFTVELPLTVVHRNLHGGARLHPQAPQFTAVDFRPADLAGIRVLVVDDEPDARDLLKRILLDCGAEVLLAEGAGEAVRLIEAERPDVMISDVGMPDVDGYELLKRVRALGRERGGRLPAVALTAFARSEDRTRALLAGFLVHVAKPVDPSELVATIASVVGRTGECG